MSESLADRLKRLAEQQKKESGASQDAKQFQKSECLHFR